MLLLFLTFIIETSFLVSITFSAQVSSLDTENVLSIPNYSEKEEILQAIHRISRGDKCNKNNKEEEKSSLMSEKDITIQLTKDTIRQLTNPFTNNSQYETTWKGIEFLSRILSKYNPEIDNYKLMSNSINELIRMDANIYRLRIVWLNKKLEELPIVSIDGKSNKGINIRYFGIDSKNRKLIEEKDIYLVLDKPWIPKKFINPLITGIIMRPSLSNPPTEWSDVYFNCDLRLWFISYSALILSNTEQNINNDNNNERKNVCGIISVDIDVSRTDIYQCDSPQDYDESDVSVVLTLSGTHKCHSETSQCIFKRGEGWVRGAYHCRCRDGYYSPVINLGPLFNGSLVEQSFQDKQDGKNPSYDFMFHCKKCAEGCDTCGDESPCLSSYNWAFRISLLTITILCIIFTLLLGCYIYRYRKLKVIKVASPIFLCITLLGCSIMYSETAAIFPVLDVWTCVLTKWTRHLGFCVTYSALLLKTWRVSLTYRVKSAHKLKLTDKQLLQWLFPILLVMAIYLSTWTISASPEAIYLVDWNGLKFKQCAYNWWDHSLVLGELLFLLWGIKVCYNVRNAESFFNEAKYITWAIYNITMVNISMIFIHILILPNAGPDVKYFFGFVRTQMSTTTTVILIFGPKFYRVIKGQGDSWDNRVRARGVTASFSINGVGLVHEETTDLYQENEELKEEIQKLASQVEIMKICQMEFKNRHLSKSKHGTQSTATSNIVNISTNPISSNSNTTQSPIVKAIYSKFDTNETNSQRISPNAELLSEKV